MTDSANSGDDVEPLVSLNHFGIFHLTESYWALSEAEQRALRVDWVCRLAECATAVHHLQTFPAESRSDLMVWSAQHMEDAGDTRAFFDQYGRTLRPFRRYVQPIDILWGFTRPSQYSRARSRQEIDPFEPRTSPYLVMYPFTKTTEWYLTKADTRQGMMNEHIRIGKQYRDIAQLLVYSVGLQDQEFVVVYETPDLALFSKLVTDLRQTEARRYTRSDAPLHTAIHRPASDLEALWP
ncbi:MAG: chlorite dismutase family protein [Longimicrobiales bacterium]